MELWKDIKDFEGLYQVSNFGNVMSLNYRLRGYNALLTPKINDKGYAWVELRKNGTRKQVLVHRLVAQEFLKNPNNYPVVNHKDENKLNNIVDNLEWCTFSYNVRYSLPKRKRKPYKSLDRVRQIDIPSGKIVREYENISEIKRILGKNEYGIRECCLGRRNKAYGYKWEFCK